MRKESTSRVIRNARLMLDAARETLHDMSLSPQSRAIRAQSIIRLARYIWGTVTRDIATGTCELRHHYGRDGGNWRAYVRCDDDAIVWASTPIYKHRQSAQRAALRARARIVRRAENAFMPITY